MTKLGTCKHAHQITEMWLIPVNPQPHEKKEEHVTLPEGYYTCQWLDTLGSLPPPVKRQNGALELRENDCDQCPLYEAVFEFGK